MPINIVLAFIPIYSLSSIFGIMPFSIKFNKNRSSSLQNNVIMKLNPIKLAFSLILLLIILLHAISIPFFVLQSNLPENNTGIFNHKSSAIFYNTSKIFKWNTKQMIIMKIFGLIVHEIMCTGALIVATCTLRNGLLQFFFKVNEADRLFVEMDNFNFMVNIKQHIFYSVGLSFFFLFSCIPVSIYHFFIFVRFHDWYGTIWGFILTWSILINFCSDLTFLFCAYLIRIRFKLINVTLKNLITIKANDSILYWKSK